MADERRPSDVSEIAHKGEVSIDRTSSLLLRRGLDALDTERMVRLQVVDLIAFEDSVFVLSDDWDESVLVERGKAIPWSQRRIVLYEFHRDGSFLRKVLLPLYPMREKRYGLIKGRVPRRLLIRGEFIHFCEKLQTEGQSRTVRIDYLVSRAGVRLAVWANEQFFNVDRVSDEPLVPDRTTLKPDCALAGTIVTIQGSWRAMI